jgi:hypothetical protein
MQWRSWRKYSRTPNTGLAKVAVQCSADTFVVNQSLFLRINICGENRHLRQARKRHFLQHLKNYLKKIKRLGIIFNRLHQPTENPPPIG